jgi:replicative DNA helicase
MNKQDYAKAYHALGFNTLPVGGDKRPAVASWERWKNERQTEEQLLALGWESDSVKGLAAIAGPVSGFLVNLDLDDCSEVAAVREILEALWLPLDYEWAVKTGKGFQIWLRCPDLDLGDTGKVLAPFFACKHIELRWTGHYSILPPSRHPSGKHYAFLYHDGLPAELPATVAAEDLLVVADWGGRLDSLKLTGDSRIAEAGEWERPCDPAVREVLDNLEDRGYDALWTAVAAIPPDPCRNDTVYHVAHELAFAGKLDKYRDALIDAGVAAGLRKHEVKGSVHSAEKRVAQRKAEREQEKEQTGSVSVVPLTAALWKIVEYTKAPMPPAIAYPWSGVDFLTRGMRRGWLTILAGYTSHGKTAAAIQIAISAARNGKRILFVSGEMSDEELGIRVAQIWGMNSRRLYSGHAKYDDTVAAEAAARMPDYQNVGIAYTRKMAVIERTVEQFKPDLLIVDYLQYLEVGRDTRLEAVTRHAQALKDIARRYKIPVLCLSQLRRPEKGQRLIPPALDDLRDSGAIEQEADQVVFVFREADEKNRTLTPHGRFIVAKARMGEHGRVDFTFNGAAQVFEIDLPAADRAKEQGWSVLEGGGKS